jgi:hypothetical protein
MPTTTRDAGGMFDELEPPAIAPGPVTEPLFAAAETPVAAPRDYGVAVAPVREATTEALFGLALTVGDNGAFALDLTD